MAYLGNYKELQLCSTASVVQETRLLQAPLDPITELPLFDQPSWYCPDGTLGLSFSYAHPWHLSVGGATVAYSAVSRCCPTSAIIDFGTSGIVSGSVSFTGYFYRVTRPGDNTPGIRMSDMTDITRVREATHLDATVMGASARRRVPGLVTGRWVFTLLLGEADAATVLRAKDTGEVLRMYLFAYSGPSLVAGNLEFGGVTYPDGGTYVSHVTVYSAEVTGSIDGLLEIVVGASLEPVTDAVLRTSIYKEIDIGNFSGVFNPNVVS